MVLFCLSFSFPGIAQESFHFQIFPGKAVKKLKMMVDIPVENLPGSRLFAGHSPNHTSGRQIEIQDSLIMIEPDGFA